MDLVSAESPVLHFELAYPLDLIIMLTNVQMGSGLLGANFVSVSRHTCSFSLERSKTTDERGRRAISDDAHELIKTGRNLTTPNVFSPQASVVCRRLRKKWTRLRKSEVLWLHFVLLLNCNFIQS